MPDLRAQVAPEVAVLSPSSKIFHSRSALAQRYGVSPRTIDRWLRRKRFPEPDLHLSGGPRWSDETIVAFERASVTKRIAP
jgi:predicted DNA-binding transcriptional regulator AlpA